MALRTYTNTEYFSEAANDFRRNKGFYTKAPRGSREYLEYWKMHKERCRVGYTVGDLSITGRHYFYLNFFPMRASLKTEDGRPPKGIQPKDITFPRFWEIDYNWWWAKEIALKGMEEADVAKLQIDGLPVKDYYEGRHLSCLKTRRAGFSYKEAADGVYNYNFIPGSKSYYFAAALGYLTSDGILNKVTDGLTHLNASTQGYWRKNRMVKDTILHRKASYIDKGKNERGYLSEIIGVPIDNPDKVRGKDGIKITYEEAGSFKNLTKALAISVPSVRDGAQLTGQISVFGTGGEEGEDIEGLEDIFTNPEAYDMLAFDNIWEEGMEGTTCGYFVPCYRANMSFMDDQGNVDVKAALEFEDKERDKKRKLKDPKKLDRHVAEFPKNPSEALQRVSANIFPIAEVNNHLKTLKNNQKVKSELMHGVLFQGKKKVEFSPSKEVYPLPFPHKNDEDLTGCVTIQEKPEVDSRGLPVPGKYFVVVDPFYKEEAKDRTSLWAAYVFKQRTRGDHSSGCAVAWYVARPSQLKTAYRNTVLLAKMYGATIQSEIAGGGQGLFDYLRDQKLVHLAEFQPELFTTTEKGANQRNRSYFMNISTDEKKNGLSYLADYLLEQIGINEEGQPVLRLHLIKDIPFLTEIVKFNPEKNFDRVSAYIVGMYMLKEKELFGLPEDGEVSDLYDRHLFGGNYNDSEGYVNPYESDDYSDISDYLDVA